MMRRLFALIGFTNLITLAAAVYFGGTVSLVLCNGCLITFGVLLFFRRRFDIRAIAIVLLSAALALGSFSFYTARSVEPMDVLDGRKVTITGRLCELPYEQYDKHYYVLEVEEITSVESPEVSLPKPDKIRISTQNPLGLDLYDRLTGSVQLYSPSGEDGFSSKSYYASKGIAMFGFLYEYEDYTVTETTDKPPYYYFLRLRQLMLDSIRSALPDKEASLLSAAILGDKQLLDTDVREDFTTSGIYHLLVVSGLHMSVVSMLLLKLFRWIRLPRRLSVCLTAAAVLAFMAITGFSPSVTRSGIMMLILLGGMFLHRKADAINSLGIAVFLICLWNPYAAADLGLLLSFASTIGILVLTPRLQTAFHSICRSVRWPILGRLLTYLGNTVSVTLGVTVFTLPLFILSGREISLIAPLSNLLLLLPGTIMIQCGFLGAVLNLLPVFAFAAKPLLLIAGLMGKLLLWGTDLLARIPFASVSPNQGFVLLWLLFSLLMLAYLLLFYHRTSGYVIGALLSVLLLCTGVFSSALLQSGQIRVAVLDVGDGIAVVVTKNGQAAVIGCEGYNENAVPNYLREENIRRVTYLQMTAGEREETENAAAILERFETEHLVLEADTDPSLAFGRSLETVGDVTYYRNSLEATVLDDVQIRMEGSFASKGILLTVYDVTFLIIGESYGADKQAAEKNAADFLIAGGLPEDTLGGVYMTAILSMDEDDLQILEGKAYLEPEMVNVYTTGGKGSIFLDVKPSRYVNIRRGS